MKIDPYKHKERHYAWKEKILQGAVIEGISKQNSDLLIRYLRDMECGLNVSASNTKGPRSFNRLNNIRQRLAFLMGVIERRYKLFDITQITEEQLFEFFNDMRNGIIKRKDGKTYQSVIDFVRYFKAFWHWWIKVNRKQGIPIIDIAMDLETKTTLPKWVYLTEEQIKRLGDEAKYEYRVLIWFLYDTGIRAPTELMNVRVSDLTEVPNDLPLLRIREESSKTFGRDIKLGFCYELLKDYIKFKNLKDDDPIFQINPYVVNRYLQRLATRIFGDGVTKAGDKYSNLTMYDFRHCSCCYFIKAYSGKEAHIKYRFGWKKSEKIYYYSRFLGIEDPLKPEDLIKGTTKTEIEKQLAVEIRDKSIMKDELSALKLKDELRDKQLADMNSMIEAIYKTVQNSKSK